MNVFTAAAAFILSAAAAAGVGGGGLLTLCLTLIYGMPQYEAQGVNLFAFVFAAIPSALYHAVKNGADLKVSAFLSFCGCTGCLLGSMLASRAEQEILRTVFGIFTLAAGVVSLISQAAEN